MERHSVEAVTEAVIDPWKKHEPGEIVVATDNASGEPRRVVVVTAVEGFVIEFADARGEILSMLEPEMEL